MVFILKTEQGVLGRGWVVVRKDVINSIVFLLLAASLKVGVVIPIDVSSVAFVVLALVEKLDYPVYLSKRR